MKPDIRSARYPVQPYFMHELPIAVWNPSFAWISYHCLKFRVLQKNELFKTTWKFQVLTEFPITAFRVLQKKWIA